jgi:hypothetical protein
MFFARSASFFDSPSPPAAPRVSVAIATWCTGVALERAVVQRRGVVADLGQVPLGELVGVDDQDAARGQVGDVRLQRGGFIATSTSGRSPGVRMS